MVQAEFLIFHFNNQTVRSREIFSDLLSSIMYDLVWGS